MLNTPSFAHFEHDLLVFMPLLLQQKIEQHQQRRRKHQHDLL
jgi:hypothetical protein